ncbi:MAG: ATP-binding cassette, subfamily bacterial [Actinomycetota bacterium]|nr:ATP-binding cassette, subfamily bacterial [Actinomycetota bacterium]
MSRSTESRRQEEKRADKATDADLPPSLESLWRMVKLAYAIEPRLLVASLLMTLAVALPQSLVGLWLALLVDGVNDGAETRVRVAALGLALSATLLWRLQVVFDRLSRRFRDRVSIALEAHVAELHATVATIAHQERREHMDRLEVLRRHTFGLDHLFMSLFSTLGWVLRLAIVEVLLMTQVHPALGLLVLFAVPTVVAATWRPGIEQAVRRRVAQHERRARHLFVLGTTAPPGKELRVTGNGAALAERRRAEWQTLYRPMARAKWGTAVWSSLAWAVFGLGYVGAVVFTATAIDASAGDVVLVLVVGSQLSQFVGAAVGELGFLRTIWLDISRRLIWLEDYAAAVDARSDGTPPTRLATGIHLEHVSFRYPGSDRLVIDDVTLDLPAGSVVAVVGDNGAGKTTLVKLLARLYDPDAGRIEVDGVDLASMSVPEWRARLAGAFQDFFRFELRALDGVGLGDLDRLGDRAAAATAVGRAGAGDVVDRLPAGLDTQLGPSWDDGIEVSFGQWQKLALARGFMRDEPLLLVLDEPTAALDAETEHALFERFAEAAREEVTNGRVTVLVSHRFSTVRMADLIVVLDGARLIEVGTHADLMALGGRYAELYGIQATAFR